MVIIISNIIINSIVTRLGGGKLWQLYRHPIRPLGHRSGIPLVTPCQTWTRNDPVKWTPWTNPVTAVRERLGKAREWGGQTATGSGRRWAGPGRRGSRQELGGLAARPSASLDHPRRICQPEPSSQPVTEQSSASVGINTTVRLWQSDR